MRMLHFPFKLPVNCSKWFEGGIRRSFIQLEAFNIINFLRIIFWIFDGSFLEKLPSNIIFASLSLNDLIINIPVLRVHVKHS